jgi:hypothetical protein
MTIKENKIIKILINIICIACVRLKINHIKIVIINYKCLTSINQLIDKIQC